MKNYKEEQITFDIDYETFSTEEIIHILDFFNKITHFVNGSKKIKKEELITSYNLYRQILNSIAFEKRYNKMFENKTGIKIYQTMRDLCQTNNKCQGK